MASPGHSELTNMDIKIELLITTHKFKLLLLQPVTMTSDYVEELMVELSNLAMME